MHIRYLVCYGSGYTVKLFKDNDISYYMKMASECVWIVPGTMEK